MPQEAHRSHSHRSVPSFRLKLLFFVALAGVVVLTVFTIRYNLRREQRAPVSDLINLMTKPLVSSNTPN